ncbi:CMP-N-acetylneuraminic acid synthetase [Desulfocapsa sulfexigens DSM 10523]|uniref:CMP-N-acetylneuraminic acid synthetase n=1 Tax=Desulfocapsa sulfexigens (strain DSM 10523 / SB164P1) TaxID=1167006 RepID=M1PBJ5_DESSD|nr:acylneuraminate cytidylyltransferase family protein [Desulfocapsa sulfexigens]AGF78987.1 CMP-N-acetylneuraminic acid synthetase [Desulfocapsa sulfexigens DSM 10523]
MNLDSINILAVVPARGGSKGIPKKNIRKIGGISLIGRVGEVVKQLPWINKVILSTDDPEMAEEGIRFGMDAPFLRPPELSSDTATGIDTWKHAFQFAEKYYDMQFDLSVYLEPTSPLRTAEDVERTVLMLSDNANIAAATVSRTPGSYTPHKTLTVDGHGHIGFYLKEGKEFSIRQKIPSYYHRNGICYAMTRAALLERNCILNNNCAAVVIDRQVVNIDEPYDLDYAQFLYDRS